MLRVNLLGEFRKSRTIPTRCPSCRAKVYFYTDDRGSKVLFDYLGPPWPKHECGVVREKPSGAGGIQVPSRATSPRIEDTYPLRFTRAGLRGATPSVCPLCRKSVVSYNEDLIAGSILLDQTEPEPVLHECRIRGVRPPSDGKPTWVSEPARHASVPAGYARRLMEQAARRAGSWEPKTASVSASADASVIDVGVLRQLTASLDMLKRVGARDTALARQLLGELGRTDWGEVTVHVDDVAEDVIGCYTMLVERAMLKTFRGHLGELVLFRAEAVARPGAGAVWVCRELERP